MAVKAVKAVKAVEGVGESIADAECWSVERVIGCMQRSETHGIEEVEAVARRVVGFSPRLQQAVKVDSNCYELLKRIL